MTTELLFNKIVIIGAGTMGRGIAQVCAMAGYTTILNDISEETLTAAQTDRSQSRKGCRKRKSQHRGSRSRAFSFISLTRFNRVHRRCGYAIEAVPEIMELKNLY